MMAPREPETIPQEPEYVHQKKKSSYSENMACMRGMGGTRFDAMPPRQYQWQAVAKRIPHEVSQLWSWLCDHTINWAALEHISPYAIDREGNELHLENAAEALKVDEGNIRRAWRWGVRVGIWGNKPHPKAKNGDRYQGRRRMYVYGDVDLDRVALESEKPEPDELPEEGYERSAQTFFGAIWKQIKDRPKSEIDTWWMEEKLARQQAADRRADLDAAIRFIEAQKEDNRWEGRGVKPKPPQEHKFKNGHAAAHAFRQQLVREVYVPKLAPVIEEAWLKRSAQTSENFAQTQEDSLRKVENEVCATAASLLPQIGPEKPRRIERAGGSEPTGQAPRKAPVERKSEPKEQYAEETTPPLSPNEEAAIAHLFTKMREYQTCFPHTKFGDKLVDPADKGDMGWARTVLSLVGADDMDGFVFDCGEQLGAIPGSLGMLPRAEDTPPGRNPTERYIGIIAYWAKQWKAKAPERAARTQRDREAKARREELIRRQTEEADLAAGKQKEQWARAEQTLKELPADKLAVLTAQAEANIKADPQQSRTFQKMTPAQRKELVELGIKKILRDTMEVS